MQGALPRTIVAVAALMLGAFVIGSHGQNPVPVLTAVSPASAPAGSAGFTFTVTGSNFVSGSAVQWNGTMLPTTYAGSTRLTATITSSDLATAGTVLVTVSNPAPGGGVSNAVTFTILPSNPLPALISMSPSAATAGMSAITLLVVGSNFISGSTVYWNGSARTTTFISATQLTATILATDLAAGGSPAVTVVTPPPGGGTSNALSFTVNNPVPVLSSLAPAAAVVGSGVFSFNANGSNFASGATVQWNGSARTTTFVSATQLRATVSASDLAAVGTAAVTVLNPTPGGGTSNSLNFTIAPVPNPVPELTLLSPSNTAAGRPAFTLSVQGAKFLSGATVRWNGANRQTTFVSATQLQGSILQSDVAEEGTALVTVFNPAPGGGDSNAMTFTVHGPPKINSGGSVNAASFSSQPVGAGSIISVFGANLASTTAAAGSLPLPTALGGVSVEVNGTAVPLFFVSPGQINLQLPWTAATQSQATIRAYVDGVAGAAETVSLAPTAPGLFSIDSTGSGQGAILIAATGEVAAPSGSITGRAARPARRGEHLSIFCTGLGDVANRPAVGAAPASDRLATTLVMPAVTIGGAAAQVTYSGLAPGFAGLYQVNVIVPADAPAGNAVSVVLTISGTTSNTVTIAVQ